MLVLGEGWDLMYKYQSEKEMNQRVFPLIYLPTIFRYYGNLSQFDLCTVPDV